MTGREGATDDHFRRADPHRSDCAGPLPAVQPDLRMSRRANFDLPDTLPLFVLPGAVLLPRTRLPLNIFEPRYLQMVEDALRTRHRLIGMIQPLDEGGRDAGACRFCRADRGVFRTG